MSEDAHSAAQDFPSAQRLALVPLPFTLHEGQDTYHRHRGTREGHDPPPSYPYHTVVDIPVFGEDDREDSDTYDSDTSEGTVLRADSFASSEEDSDKEEDEEEEEEEEEEEDEEEEETDVTGATSETDEDFWSEDLPTSTYSSGGSLERRKPELTLSSCGGEWNTPHNFTSTPDESPNEVTDINVNYRRDININAQELRWFRTSELQPLLPSERAHGQRATRGSALSRLGFYGRRGRSRSERRKKSKDTESSESDDKKKKKGGKKSRRRSSGGDSEEKKEEEGDKKKSKKRKGSLSLHLPKRRKSDSSSGSDSKKGDSSDKDDDKDKSRDDRKGRRSSEQRSRKRRSSKGGKGKKKKSKKTKVASESSGDFGMFYKQKDHPSSIYFILGSEFCERFTYFGLRTILVLYLTNWLNLTRNTATAVFHMFSSMAYFSPIFGAILADSYIGRYKTILSLSFIYAIGCIILAATALPPPECVGPFVGLFLISIGTGGIKPCVVTFGGDQFDKKQVRHKASFFSTFYFVINIGSLLSTFITPILRSDVHCVENSCYPLAFGVPAILMTLALIVFYAGSSSYKYIEPTGSLLTKTIRCLTSGAEVVERKDKKHRKKRRRKKRNKNQNRGEYSGDDEEHIESITSPLDVTHEKFDAYFVQEVRMMTRLVWLFLPLPMFWALFNQQGSRWTLQASQLDGRFSFLGALKPEQMQALNPLLIVLLIPVFERVIYPCMKSCKIPHRPLQRMVVGMLFSALAFVFAALLQMKIQDSMEKPVPANLSGYTIFNTVDCKLHVQGYPRPFYQGSVAPFGQSAYFEVHEGKKMVSVNCPRNGLQAYAEANLESGKAFRLVVTAQPGLMKVLVLEEKREKSTNGTAFVSFLHLLTWVASAKIKITSTRGAIDPVIMKVSLTNATSFHVFEPGSYQVSFPSFSADKKMVVTTNAWEEVGKPIEVGNGGIYTVAFIDPSNSYDFDDVVVEMYVDVKENSLSMILMIPQYIAITVGEILFSISGLAFAYTQSPESMKSIIQAMWLLTTSVGDIIVVLVAEMGVVSDQINEFWLFAALMLIDTLLFAVTTCFYTYSDEKQGKSKKDEKKGKGKGKKRDKRKGKRKGGGDRKKRRDSESEGSRDKHGEDKKGSSKEEEEGKGDHDKKKKGKEGKGKKKKGKDKKEKGSKNKKRRGSKDEDTEDEDGDKKKRKSKGDKRRKSRDDRRESVDDDKDRKRRKSRDDRRRSRDDRRKSRDEGRSESRGRRRSSADDRRSRRRSSSRRRRSSST